MRAIIFPCAGSLPIDLQIEFGPIPAACLPLGSSIVLERILKPNLEAYDKIFVVFSDEFPVAKNVCKNLSDKIEVFNVGKTSSIAETLFKTLSQIPEHYDLITVQMGDAYHDNPGPFQDAICVKKDRMTNRWVSMSLRDNGLIEHFHPPGSTDTSNTDIVFAGKFSIANTDKFYQYLIESVFQTSSAPHILYQALTRYYNDSGAAPLFEDSSWQDFGYASSYYEFRQTSGFNERDFNNITFDRDTNTIRKVSENKEKLISEINWYQTLPKSLTFASPRIIDSDTSLNNPFVQMSYEAGIPVDQMFLYSKSYLSTWNDIWTKIQNILDRFIKEAKNHSIDIAHASKNIYLEKTLNRMKAYSELPLTQPFQQNELVINNQSCMTVNQAIDYIKIKVNSPLFLKNFHPSVIHGDMCFSNILFDSRLGKLTLIDPRGTFGSAGIYGDLRYDLAKLHHSFSGNYDFLVRGYFEMIESEKSYELKIATSSHHDDIRNLFISKMKQSFGDVYSDICFIEALLFLSMIPLHADNPRSQKAFLVRGLELISSYARSQEDL